MNRTDTRPCPECARLEELVGDLLAKLAMVTTDYENLMDDVEADIVEHRRLRDALAAIRTLASVAVPPL